MKSVFRLYIHCMYDFPLSLAAGADDPVASAALRYFGVGCLFPWQRMVISNILDAWRSRTACVTEGDDDTDSFSCGRQIVILPTGAGKSLCFQVPSLFLDGPTLAVYPLLALMVDQKRRLEECGIRCAVFRGGQSREEREMNFAAVRGGAPLIIVNPEILRDGKVSGFLAECGIAHAVVDEAHCVCEWGDTFRPAYLELGKMIGRLNPPLVTAFTATASGTVLSRISSVLFGGSAHVVRGGGDRPNIHYSVMRASAKKKAVLGLAAAECRPMLVFCGKRRMAEEMARELNEFFGDFRAKFYHAALDRAEKERVENWFMESADGILCSTCAYGMGVDKGNIRTVVHIAVPDSAEAYAQESGRAGRDGLPAKAILVWSLRDGTEASRLPVNSRKSAMSRFAQDGKCRRGILLDSLGAAPEVCCGCDVCDGKTSDSGFAADWEVALSMIRRGRRFWTGQEFRGAFGRRMGAESSCRYGSNIWTSADTDEVVSQLLVAGKIRVCGHPWKDRITLR